MDTSTKRTEYGIKHNTRIKQFPDGSGQILCASRQVFREPGYERAEQWAKADARAKAKPEAHSEAIARAQRRARSQIYDYARSNDFMYFVTFTLDPRQIDRYDIKEVVRRMNVWLDNRVRRYGLKYILVPELHQDGAIHFHGFINDTLWVRESGTMIPPGGGKPRRPRSAQQRAEWEAAGGHVVYNLPSWTFGFTALIKLYGDYSAAIGYVCKYVTKSTEKIGGRWFFHGGALRKPEVTYADLNLEDLQQMRGARSFETDTLCGVNFCMVDFEGEEDAILCDGSQQENREKEVCPG